MLWCLADLCRCPVGLLGSACSSGPIHDVIVNDPNIDWVGCCNELNAGYAADGYARVRGVGALSTTYGVGELSAINAVAGSYAEHLPVFHLTGMPSMPVQAARSLVHHTLGNGEFDLFCKMAEPVVCASAIMTPQNVAYETERLIATALYHRRPVYMAFPSDLANEPVLGRAQPLELPASDPASLDAAVTAIVDTLDAARTACVLPGMLAVRAGLRDSLQAFVDASGLPYATMFGDKSVLNEQHPSYIGMYDGKLMDEDVRAFVESCDQVLCVGTVMTDSTPAPSPPPSMKPAPSPWACTAPRSVPRPSRMSKCATFCRNSLSASVHPPQLLRCAPGRWATSSAAAMTRSPPRRCTPRWERFFRPEDTIITETGSSSMGLGFAHLPTGATFHNQTLWGSIGWATPAAFGAAVAHPHGRVILVTGDGSHQLTAQEISQFGRRGLRPIIFVLNNNGYLVERFLCKDPNIAYNDIASWNYAEIPHALGCNDWYSARATTCGELDNAITVAAQANTGAYIEVVTDTYAASELVMQLHDNLATLYNT
jgi:indolepyruvate decarboxylase